ncbi:MAG: hypothetical protein GY755_18845 [Chloroflexi bacterium]|nr:hypothetical protein [Chloroflexota bacterium]
MFDNMTQRKVPKRKNLLGYFKIIPLIFVFFLFGIIALSVILGFDDDYIFIGFALIIIPLSIGMGVLEGKIWRDRWREFAERSGFTYEEYKQFMSKWARVKGTSRGYSFVIEKFVRGSGKYKKSYTSIKVALRANNEEDLEISARNIFSGLGKAFQGQKKLQYVELSDVELDGKLLVKSTSEQFARRTISSMSIRQGLLDIRSQTSSMNLKLENGEVYYHELNVIADGEYLLAVINLLVELAENVERYS